MVSLKRVVNIICNNKDIIVVFCLVLMVTLSFSTPVYAQSATICPISVLEGGVVQLSPIAFDPDPEIGPAGMLIWEYGHPFDSSGRWQTLKGVRGVFPFWVSVSDGELKDTERSCVEVLPNNRNPVLEPIPEVFVKRGEGARIEASCYDPDKDPVTISYRFQGKDVAFISYEPPGVYRVDVICSDGYGGVDTGSTRLHILLPDEEKEELPIAKVPVYPSYVPSDSTISPDDIDMILPEEILVEVSGSSGTDLTELDVVYSGESEHEIIDCLPCPVDDSVIVVLDTGAVNELEMRPEGVVFDPVISVEKTDDDIARQVSACEENIERKKEVDTMLGCCI